MTPKEFDSVLLLLAAQGDPQKAAQIAGYLSAMVMDGKRQEAAQPAEPESELADGIYLVFGNQSPVMHQLYIPGSTPVTDWMKEHCTGVAVKLGEKSICVDLYNMADGEEITLTSREDKTGWDGYKDNALDAGADWDGEGNTKHLLNVGLNPKIVLDRGQFIPSVAQWRFICLFRKELNQALAELGGDELTGWYWTSTEYSATYAWGLYLSNGNMYSSTKASSRYRVRAVSAFII